MTHDASVIQDWLDQALASRRTTKWEKDFLECLAEQFEEKQWISLAQEDRLEQIYADRT